MITTVTINPAVDKTYIIHDFKPFKLNRADRIIYNAGSKGINVSRVLTQIGAKTCVLGFVGGRNGDILLTELSGEGIDEDLVRVNADTRLNVKIMDLNTHMVTEVNEQGSPITESELETFISKYKEYAKKSRAIVISGSIPPEMSKRIYFDLIKIAKLENKPVFLDCGGSILYESIKASPDYIKPNRQEFCDMLGKESITEEEILKQAKRLIETYGIRYIVVTLGKDGAIGVSKNEAYKVIPPNVEVVSTVGAGDAFLAGLCHGYLKGVDLKSQLILATSFSSAKITKEGTNVPSMIELIGYTDGCVITNMNA